MLPLTYLSLLALSQGFEHRFSALPPSMPLALCVGRGLKGASAVQV